MAAACSTSRRIGKTVGEAQARAYEAVDAHPLAGRLLPPRHRLARGRTGTALMQTRRSPDDGTLGAAIESGHYLPRRTPTRQPGHCWRSS